MRVQVAKLKPTGMTGTVANGVIHKVRLAVSGVGVEPACSRVGSRIVVHRVGSCAGPLAGAEVWVRRVSSL